MHYESNMARKILVIQIASMHQKFKWCRNEQENVGMSILKRDSLIIVCVMK